MTRVSPAVDPVKTELSGERMELPADETESPREERELSPVNPASATMLREMSYTDMYLNAMQEEQSDAENNYQLNLSEDENSGSQSINRFRVAGSAVMATLPSSRLQHSQTGAVLGRKLARDQKRKVSSIQTSDGANTRRRNSRRGTINLEMLDQAAEKGLKMSFDDDDDYDAVERLKQLEVIKQMPIAMYLKRKLRNRLFEGMPDLESGTCDACTYKCKLDCYKCGVRSAFCWRDFRLTTTLWSGAFKNIEGHFGSGVLTYFRFLKWLFQLNFGIFLLVFFFIILPEVIFNTDGYTMAVTGSVNLTDAQTLAANCSANYVVNTSSSTVQLMLDFLQGTGWMEQTAVFYGYYSDQQVVAFSGWRYNMPLAYIIISAVYFLMSLVLMVHHTARGFREKLFASEDSLKQYCNSVFASWDFGMDDKKNCRIKHKSIHREMTGNIEAEREARRMQNRSGKEKCKTYSLRVLVNVLVVALLGGSGYLIYWVTLTMTEIQERDDFLSYSYIVQFLVEFTSSLTITMLNGMVPLIFKKVVVLEDYTPSFTLNITLARTVFLRLASVGVLIFTLYSEITCSPQDSCGVGISPGCTSIQCWETHVGQELYKLVIMDFITVIVVTFLVEFPRKLIVSKCDCKLSKIIGPQQFDITKNVLDLVYSEVLLWLGTFFAPMIPVICVIKLFIIFYVKQLSLLVCCVPSNQPYKAHESRSFILLVLTVAFIVCLTPVYFVVFRMSPSPSCGPFRIYEHMYDILPITVDSWPEWIQSIFEWIGSAMIIIPIFVILCLTIYYLDQMWKSYRAMTIVLKEQLHMEGKDKQFLLARIHELSGTKKAPAGHKPSSKAKPPAAIGEEIQAPPYSKKQETFSNHSTSPFGVTGVDV